MWQRRLVLISGFVVGLLLGGLRSILAETRAATVFAVVAQAAVFGFVHLYQGPAGIAGATISGLVYGTITS